MCYQRGDGRLARARRAPEQYGAHTVGDDESPQERALSQNWLLANHIIQFDGSHSISQWAGLREPIRPFLGPKIRHGRLLSRLLAGLG